MIGIIPEILTLAKYIDLATSHNPAFFRPEQCSCGMASPWCHGHYSRKLAHHQEENFDPSEPVPIFRYFCNHCHKTCSVIPECISPRRWYMWLIQQAVFVALLAGYSIRSISTKESIARSTCRRWWQRLQEQFLSHRDALRKEFPELGLHENFKDFWTICLQKISLARAMRVCFETGVAIP